MNRTSAYRFLLVQCAACCSIIAAGACDRTAPAPTAPPESPAPSLSIAFLQQEIPPCLAPGMTISGPEVLVRDADGRPAPNVTVLFSVTAGGGTLSRASDVTNGSGVASAGDWRLGPDSGANWAMAALQSGTTLHFVVWTSSAVKVVAALQLQTIGGRPLPQAYPDWTITGGHYYLAANHTYEFGYEVNGTPTPPSTICSNARYETTGNGILFYLAPGTYPQSTFYQERSGLFATGTINSPTTMSVKYEDILDFEDEVYQLASGAWP